MKTKNLRLSEILTYSGVTTVDALFARVDAVLEIAREDVARMASSKGIFFHDFDFTFSIASDNFKNILRKRTKAINNLITCGDVSAAAEFLVGRILSDMRNFTTNPNYRNYHSIEKITQTDDVSVLFKNNNLSGELDFDQLDFKQIKFGLRKLYDENYTDFDNLCYKYGLNPAEILGFEPSEMPKFEKIKNENGNTQMILSFDEDK